VAVDQGEGSAQPAEP
ncbi:hypothetical protein Tco_0643133, partial [Tanacetum coccineum]